ncbi:hypothetical protein Celaphus_00016485 [Cervus elaphus hippelaphus]|uniref:Uncharacterized protein n=1 Tax=Cervus elaphus hippelaphus TaxID=46360 RepID=A0A212C467_CEREH|nr:hypothetical protein Celaphus_00016485 [Cervus elaphus hippelaphus]
MNEFTNMPVPPKPSQALGDKIVRDSHPRAAFEPTYICRLLTMIKWSLSEKDGQKMLRLQEEMLNRKKLLSPDNENLTVSSGPKSHSVNEEEQEEPGEGSEDEWEQAAFVQTPIAGIFGGHIRSVVYQQSSKESATGQPFFNLQLDIQSDKIHTVQDVLGSLVARESVQGDTTKTEQEVEINGRGTLEKLLPGLLLCLQWFVYRTGGCQTSSEILTILWTWKLQHHRWPQDVSQVRLKGWGRAEEQTVTVISPTVKAKASSKSEAHCGRAAHLLRDRIVDLL